MRVSNEPKQGADGVTVLSVIIWMGKIEADYRFDFCLAMPRIPPSGNTSLLISIEYWEWGDDQRCRDRSNYTGTCI